MCLLIKCLLSRLSRVLLDLKLVLLYHFEIEYISTCEFIVIFVMICVLISFITLCFVNFANSYIFV